MRARYVMPVTLMLLPGLLCDHRLWQYQLPHFADARVADLTRDDTIPAMAARTLVAAPKRFALAGLSMGGYVAFEILRQAPERVTHLALFATSARADEAAAVRRRKGLIGLVRQHRFLGVSRRLLPSLLHPDNLTNQPLCELVVRMAADLGREVYLRQQAAILARPESRESLEALRIPALIGAGAADQTTPPDRGREIADLIPGAEFQLFERSGHLPPLEEPDAVTQAIENILRR